MLTILHDKEIYNPTYPQNIGVGVGLRKIIGMNLLVSFSVFPLKTDTDLSSSITDFQMHKYGKKLLIDGYYQDYRGFYTQKEQDNKKAYTLFPNLAVKRWGLMGLMCCVTSDFPYVLPSSRVKGRSNRLGVCS